MRTVCIGMSTIDTLLFVPSINTSSDGVTRVSRHVQCLGGKGYITATALKHAGCRATLLSLTPQSATEQSELLGLRHGSGATVAFALPFLARNNRVWITIADSQKVFSYVDRAPLKSVQLDIITDITKRHLKASNCVLMCAEHKHLLMGAARVLGDSSTRVLLNLSLPILNDPSFTDEDCAALVACADVVILNGLENRVALRVLRTKSWAGVRSDRLQEVIVTEGTKGGYHLSRPFRSRHRYSAIAVEDAVCPVGAGDTFFGGYAAARFLDGLPADESCARGAALAAAKVRLRQSHL